MYRKLVILGPNREAIGYLTNDREAINILIWGLNYGGCYQTSWVLLIVLIKFLLLLYKFALI